MLSVREHQSFEEASRSLLDFVLQPRNWVHLDALIDDASRPGLNPSYQRRVGSVRICASVDVGPQLQAFLRIAFRGPGLSPSKAADLLADFLRDRMPLMPNSEWQVEVDPKGWCHFMRPYVGATLQA
jgi:hypothetical protein